MMNQEDIFQKTGQILRELNVQYAGLSEQRQPYDPLEIALFQASANFLSDHVQILARLNDAARPQPATPPAPVQETAGRPELPEAPSQAALPEAHHPVETELFKPDTAASTFEFLLDQHTSDRFEFEERPVEEIFDRPLSEEEAQIIAQKQRLREKDSLMAPVPEEDEIGPEPFLVHPAATPEPVAAAAPVEIPEPVAPSAPAAIPVPAAVISPAPEPRAVPAEPVTIPLAETPAFTPPQPAAAEPAHRPTLNDMLSGQLSGTARSESSWTAVTDLRQAISLNDKLRYIKDLFNGYNLAYAEAIDLLNKMPDFKTAEAFLRQHYAGKHNWADKPDTAEQFYELLRQRFPVK